MPSQPAKAPALPSFGDPSQANLFPFAVLCAGWIVPLLKFWAAVWGVFRPSDYAGGEWRHACGSFWPRAWSA